MFRTEYCTQHHFYFSLKHRFSIFCLNSVRIYHSNMFSADHYSEQLHGMFKFFTLFPKVRMRVRGYCFTVRSLHRNDLNDFLTVFLFSRPVSETLFPAHTMRDNRWR